jgi:hypothetical protein
MVNATPEMDPIEFLVLRKYPHSVSSSPLGTIPIKQLESFQKEIVEATAYRAVLQEMPAEQIQSLYEEERQKLFKELNNKNDAEEAARFFNKPNALADFEHWGRAKYWTLDEAIALSFGKDPRVVFSKAVLSLVHLSNFAQKYRDRLDLATRAIIWKELSDPVSPRVFIGWLKKNGYDFPADLETEVIKRGGHAVDCKAEYEKLIKEHSELKRKWQAAREKHYDSIAKSDFIIAKKDAFIADLQARLEKLQDKPLGERERQTVLKMIIGMAVGGYGFDPKAAKSPASKDIEGDIALSGLTLDVDTVRKWLKEAATLLPREAAENQD